MNNTNTIFVPNSELYIDHCKSETTHTTFQHYHDAYEIYVQLDGKRYIYHDNLCHTMERGDVMVLEPFAIHYTTSEDSEGYERIVLNFTPEKLNGILTDSEIYMLRDKLRSGVMHVDDNALTELIQRFDTCVHYSEKKGFLSEKLLYSAVMQFVMTIIEYTCTPLSAIHQACSILSEPACPNPICIAVSYQSFALIT